MTGLIRMLYPCFHAEPGSTAPNFRKRLQGLDRRDSLRFLQDG